MITPNKELHELIEQNHRLLLLMDHFETGFCVADKTIADICGEKGINPEIFAAFCNIYNGDLSNLYVPKSKEDIAQIIAFLENTHCYYLNDMYPEIKHYISELGKINTGQDVRMLEMFFESYFAEVKKHLEYEQEKLFPLIRAYCNGDVDSDELTRKSRKLKHSEIEVKLSDLKNLLLKHIRLVDKNGLKRKLIASLMEFQYDLNIHSLIEDEILIKYITK